MSGLVSVIIPVYNGEKTIKKCLRSIKKQTYGEIEIIVIDDGSTDNSRNEVMKEAQRDRRILYFKQENAGVSAARNSGLDIAKGKYIVFCDSDDFVKADYIEVLVRNLEQYNADWVISGFIKVINDKHYIFAQPYEIPYISHKEEKDFLKNWYKNPYIAGPWAKLYLRKIIENNHVRFPWDINHGEDTIFNIDYYKNCTTVRIVSEAFYYYVENNQSLTKKNRTDIWDNQLQIFEKYKQMIVHKKYGTELSSTFLIRGVLLSLNHARFNRWGKKEWKSLCCEIQKNPYFKEYQLEKLGQDKFAYIIGYLLKKDMVFLIGWIYRIKFFIFRHTKKIYYLLKR